MENTLTELNNPLRMNRDARASSAGLSSNDKPFSVETIKERYWKRERRPYSWRGKQLWNDGDDPDTAAIVKITFTTTFQLA